jgi:opacity protein-like surface antigen
MNLRYKLSFSTHCILAAFLSGSAITQAEDPWSSELYYTGSIVSSYSQVEDVTVTPDSVELSTTDEHDAVLGLSVALGKSYGGLRYELEYTWRYRFDLNVQAITYYPRIRSDVQTDTLMISVYKDFSPWKSIKPYLGLGVGYVRNRNESELLVHLRPGEALIPDTSTTSDVAWSVGVGFTRVFSENWLWDAGYRYIDLGGIESGPYPGEYSASTLESGSYVAHEFRIGLRRDF